MEFDEVVRRRHMTRSFSPEPVSAGLVDRLAVTSLGAPRAGNTDGTAWVVLHQGVGAGTEPFWNATTTAEWRERSRRFGGLSRAPVVAVSLASPEHYVDRYGEDDKAASGLGPPAVGGRGTGGWPVPYWFGDAAFATLTLVLGATDAGLGTCFLGNFRGEAALLEALAVPDGWRLFGSVLLGHPDGDDPRSASLDRPAAPRTDRVHQGRWRPLA